MKCAALVSAIIAATNCLASAGQPDAMKPVRVNGVELHYLERGQGEPVVFVHGAAGQAVRYPVFFR